MYTNVTHKGHVCDVAFPPNPIQSPVQAGILLTLFSHYNMYLW